MRRILVKKMGNNYAFTDPGGDQSHMVGIQTDPEPSGTATLFAFKLSDSTLATSKGGNLMLAQNSHNFTITVLGDTMTWDEAGTTCHFLRVTGG
jgi:hypothetical protein